ncbi:type II secretion system minor pseudopilin GspI [Legionella fairfieldensis]|uniref:type II secretion system minor pseudopilin GspI n=1 Tax=Legionella fairfieldensis TaxID=45064 RepID=UPI000688B8C1|nr:type II secretion system minor pseudopilin GspI [Legionella fairfieldensis]
MVNSSSNLKNRGKYLPGKKYSGFTLVEVLLALSVIAIALTALLKATAQNVSNTQRIKEKTVSHWIALQGVTMIQLGLVQVPPNQTITKVTSMLGQRWYWRASSSQTPIKFMQQITITVSKNQAGPFTDPLIAFWYPA